MPMSKVDRRTRRLEKRYPQSGFKFPSIAGYDITYHAAIRMLARGIDIDAAIDALKAPGRPGSGNGTQKHVGDYATCVVNPIEKVIVTVGYGRLNMVYEDD